MREAETAVTVPLLPKQREFLTCNAKWAGARGGKGSGKTTALAWWLIQRLEMYPNAAHYVAGATFPQLREGIFQTISGLLETVLRWKQGREFGFREKSQSPVIVFNHSGAELASITAEQRGKVNSLEIQTLVCEEPQEWDHGETFFPTIVTRLRHSQRSASLYPDMVPSGRMSFNPPVPAHWLHELIERRWPKLGYPCWQFSLRDNYLMPNLADYIRTIEGQIPEHLWDSEIDGNWRVAGASFFPFKDLQDAEDPALSQSFRLLSSDDYGRLAWGELWVGEIPWHNRYPNSRYVHFWDLADKQDWTVGITIDATVEDRLTVVEFERFNRTGWKHIYDRIRDRNNRYRIGHIDSQTLSATSKTYIDSTGVGDAVLDELQDIDAEGLKFTAPKKAEILAGLQSVLSTRELKYPMIPVLFDELRFYERDDKDLTQDCVMALAGAVHFAKRRDTPFFAFNF